MRSILAARLHTRGTAPPHLPCAWAGNSLDRDDAVDRLHAEYRDLSPVHTLNNLAVVVWALCASDGDFSAAVGNAVAAGWDTDCNGATVGGLVRPDRGANTGLLDAAVERPGRRRVSPGTRNSPLDDLVDRTVAVARTMH